MATKPKDYDRSKLSMTDYALAGAFSAVPTTVITTPMERIKVVMQTQDQIVGGKKYTGMFDAGAGMFREGGISGLYRGTVATLARDAPGSAAYFVAYEYFYQLLKPRDGKLSIGATLFAGGSETWPQASSIMLTISYDALLNI